MYRFSFWNGVHLLVIAGAMIAVDTNLQPGLALAGAENGDYVCFGHTISWDQHACPCPSTSVAQDTCANNVPLGGGIDSESQDCGMDDETACTDSPGQIACGQIYVCNVDCGETSPPGDITCWPTQKNPPNCSGSYGCTPNES